MFSNWVKQWQVSSVFCIRLIKFTFLYSSRSFRPDILSTRSKAFQELNIDLDEISMNELIDLIEKNPSLLRRPIILDDRRMQVGYNEDEIRRFLPRSVRRLEMAKAKRLADQD